MHFDRHLCANCPGATNDLDLLETRFQNGLCFLELECRHCVRLWTAEVSMPTEEDFKLAAARPGLPKPIWHIVNIVARPLVERASMRAF